MSGYTRNPTWSPPRPTPERPAPPTEPPLGEEAMATLYGRLRLVLADIEQLFGTLEMLAPKEEKATDKAMVLMKLGAKMLKKLLKARGWSELKPPALRRAA